LGKEIRGSDFSEKSLRKGDFLLILKKKVEKKMRKKIQPEEISMAKIFSQERRYYEKLEQQKVPSSEKPFFAKTHTSLPSPFLLLTKN